MEAAEQWEPDDTRVSRPVLRERGDEIPPRHSPLSQDRWPHGLSVARRRRRGRGPRCAGPGETEQAGSAETHAQAFEEIWLPVGGSGHGRFAILPRRRARSWDRASALHLPMARQPGREFASTDPTTRTQDAGLQERRISAKISHNPPHDLQHIQRPTPSHLSQDAPSFPGLGHADMARSRRRSVSLTYQEICYELF